MLSELTGTCGVSGGFGVWGGFRGFGIACYLRTSRKMALETRQSPGVSFEVPKPGWGQLSPEGPNTP